MQLHRELLKLQDVDSFIHVFIINFTFGDLCVSIVRRVDAEIKHRLHAIHPSNLRRCEGLEKLYASVFLRSGLQRLLHYSFSLLFP